MEERQACISKSWAKHNQLFEKHNQLFQKDNEQFEKRNRLLVRETPSPGCETASRGPFATVQMGIRNRVKSLFNQAKRKKAGVCAPAFAAHNKINLL